MECDSQVEELKPDDALDLFDRPEDQISKQVANTRALVDRLVKDNLFFVEAIAKQYLWSGLDLEDLVQEGSIGLITAAQKCDPDKINNFRAYARFWIVDAIKIYIADNCRIVSLSVYFYKEAVRYRTAFLNFQKQYGRRPTDEELANQLGVSENDVKNFRDAALLFRKRDVYVGLNIAIQMGALRDRGEGDSELADYKLVELYKNVSSLLETFKDYFFKYYRATKLQHRDVSGKVVAWDIFINMMFFADTSVQELADRWAIGTAAIYRIRQNILDFIKNRLERLDFLRELMEYLESDGDIVRSILGKHGGTVHDQDENALSKAA